ncbi:MAG TPA: enoyl-CoA hydratase-related protein [Candidatus Thermoplasmatota archaeon]|nr:enoyl-CoA hydratase-related protein [Candidatus Thermoplasmatota archaeon]
MPGDLLRRDTRNGILTLTLDRPEVRNALNPDLLAALLAALKEAADPAVRCVVLAAEGPVFCAGGDVEDMQRRQGKPLATKARQEEAFGALARALLTFPKPTVARLQGDAYGAGLMLALCCDFALAADTVKVGATFSRMALVPDTAGSFLLPRLVGLRAARELYLLADPVPAPRAADLGLVTEAVPAADLAGRVEALARRLADGPTLAYGLGKRALLLGATQSLEEALATEANLQGLCFTLADHQEAVDAFLGKRKPAFTGR